ncbi:hypothetical protein ACFWN7_02165 [Agromyces sp. NPDC058484]|uniref:hypothetical protein n=1 Tax=Agromyces sp. NPDC058484 TaxID=3346524 RepID=UPI00364C93D4
MVRLEDVREGMDVIDASGQKVGTVKSVKMGDPQAVTAEGQTVGERDGLLDVVADLFTGSEDMPAEERERLLRVGYIEVDGTGIGGNFFAAADAVEEVSEDSVRLSTDRTGS